MSGDGDAGSPRPRPLSGGFWTLLSWLRRDEQSSSNDSLSSAGSDRTAVSFAFLAPAHYHSSAPVVVPPPGPPSDTYKRRVRERNLRRQYDRDTTLHRKYGLFRGEAGAGYDAFSLPPARLRVAAGAGAERVRRAASECGPRRPAHVPGKRRAPPPPQSQPHPHTARRRARKRPAPQPPVKLDDKSKENIDSSKTIIKITQMSDHAACNKREVGRRDAALEVECKPEKYTRKTLRDDKVRPEKSFLKQIFENKKRISADVSMVKLLPSISELDKQAAEIIESKKLKKIDDVNRQNSKEEKSNCVKCPKGFCFCNNIDVVPSGSNILLNRNTTMYTQTEGNLVSAKFSNKEEDEKQKLKNMLKEMKDSLPKRTKHENKVDKSPLSHNALPNPPEQQDLTNTPTLRIGSSNSHEFAKSNVSPLKTPKKELQKRANDFPFEESPGQHAKIHINQDNQKTVTINTVLESSQTTITSKQPNTNFTENNNLHTPLKISSLLNPIYVPKSSATPLRNSVNPSNSDLRKEDKKKVETSSQVDSIYVKTADTVRDIILKASASGNLTPPGKKPSKSSEQAQPEQSRPIQQQPVLTEQPKREPMPKDNISHSPDKIGTNIERLSEHSRRRELVNQLELSIARGDEQAAAEAATKLAQLRLSCSVLSFTSHILGEPSTSSARVTEASSSTSETTKVKSEIGKVTKKDAQTSAAGLLKEVETSKTTNPGMASGSSVSEVKKNNDNNLPSEKKEIKVPLTKASTSKVTEGDTDKNNNITSIQIWIEDKVKARGPIQLHVRRKSNVGDLRRQAEQSLGLPARMQRWIVGRTLCNDDSMPLTSLAGPNLDAPFYLCLVESDTTSNEGRREQSNEKKGEVKDATKSPANDKKTCSDVYTELVNLERQALVPNTETFECDICMEQCGAGDGVVLRECVHSFCKGCLSDVIRHCEEPAVSCPATGCPGELLEREVRALVSAEDYERWLARGLAAAESGTRNAFHCRTRDCTGWAMCEIEVRRFPCPVCKRTNCIPCRAIHENETCEQYQAKLLAATTTNIADKTDEGTQALIDSLITRGEALECPECTAIITKKWGCDWVKCSACKTEICWVTRGRRWGPGGRGDTSGGCQCGVDGKRCHPSCGYCH